MAVPYVPNNHGGGYSKEVFAMRCIEMQEKGVLITQKYLRESCERVLAYYEPIEPIYILPDWVLWVFIVFFIFSFFYIIYDSFFNKN